MSSDSHLDPLSFFMTEKLWHNTTVLTHSFNEWKCGQARGIEELMKKGSSYPVIYVLHGKNPISELKDSRYQDLCFVELLYLLSAIRFLVGLGRGNWCILVNERACTGLVKGLKCPQKATAEAAYDCYAHF